MFDPILQREVTSDEYFTPDELISKHVNDLDINEKYIDNCCGIGNWLVKILEMKLAAGIDHETALDQLYGVEFQQDSTEICRNRLLQGQEHLRHIVEKNIVCADSLRYHYRFDGTDPYQTEQDLLVNSLFTFD
jgi:type I restriction-modification system DNA methylase subunit